MHPSSFPTTNMSKVTLNFLQDLFEDVHVESFEESPGSERGDNYTAILYRISIKGTKENGEAWSKRIIYKCLPESTLRREAYKSEKLFKNEVIFYTKVLPLLQNYQEMYMGKKFEAVPKCYYAKNNVLVLEDLCDRGFKMANRKQGLNFPQMVAVLKELALFHALSLAVKAGLPDKFYSLIGKSGIHEVLFSRENEEWYREYYKHARQNALSMVNAGLETSENKGKYIGRLHQFLDDNFFVKMIELVSDVRNLAVFCHGDCWTNNFFFKTSENQDIQVYFIDFQICRFGSLALDLANLIYCCTTRSLRDVNLEAFLDIYCNNLYETLNGLLDKKYEVKEREVLFELVKSEFRRCGLFGLGLAIDIMPISTCDSDQAPDLYVSEGEENDKSILVLNPNEICKTKMVNLVTELVDNDIL